MTVAWKVNKGIGKLRRSEENKQFHISCFTDKADFMNEYTDAPVTVTYEVDFM